MIVEKVVSGLNHSAKKIYLANKEKGFWDSERNIGELLMLVTSELGEALEAHRKGRNAPVSMVQSRCMFESAIKDTFEDEIADTVIRLLDLCGGLKIDIDNHINAKLAYNKTREKLHGKKY